MLAGRKIETLVDRAMAQVATGERKYAEPGPAIARLAIRKPDQQETDCDPDDAVEASDIGFHRVKRPVVLERPRVERVAIAKISGLEAAPEPTHALRRRAMRKGIGHDNPP